MGYEGILEDFVFVFRINWYSPRKISSGFNKRIREDSFFLYVQILIMEKNWYLIGLRKADFPAKKEKLI